MPSSGTSSTPCRATRVASASRSSDDATTATTSTLPSRWGSVGSRNVNTSHPGSSSSSGSPLFQSRIEASRVVSRSIQSARSTSCRRHRLLVSGEWSAKQAHAPRSRVLASSDRPGACGTGGCARVTTAGSPAPTGIRHRRRGSPRGWRSAPCRPSHRCLRACRRSLEGSEESCTPRSDARCCSPPVATAITAVSGTCSASASFELSRRNVLFWRDIFRRPLGLPLVPARRRRRRGERWRFDRARRRVSRSESSSEPRA